MKQIQNIVFALQEYQRLNPQSNDTDAYLYALGQWALGLADGKPDPKDYGITDLEE